MPIKFVSAKKPTAVPAVVLKRNKLVKALWEQMQLASATAQGQTYAPVVVRSRRNAEGVKVSVQVPKRVRSWVWTGDDGKQYLSLRYGARELPLAKGCNAVAIEDANALDVLSELKAMAEQGSFDDAIATLASSADEGVKR